MINIPERMKLDKIFLPAAILMHLAGCATVSSPDNAWKTPSRPFPPYTYDQFELMDELMRPCVEHAQNTFSEAARRFSAGLPSGSHFVAVAGQPDPYVYADSVYILIDSVREGRIYGHIRDDRYELNGARYDFPIERLGDWFIDYLDRPEEGNWRGKYALLRQDGLVSGPCDPGHAEFQHFRLFRDSYSFVPPTGSNWRLSGAHVISDGSAYVDMWMQEVGSSVDELNTLSSMTHYESPSFHSIDEFIEYAVVSDEEAWAETERYKPIHNDAGEYPGLGAMCVKTHRVVEDRFALLKSSNKRGPMVREIKELGCVHPSRDDLIIRIVYSHRYQPGNRDAEFDDNVEGVFSSLAFSRIH